MPYHTIVEASGWIGEKDKNLVLVQVRSFQKIASPLIRISTSFYYQYSGKDSPLNSHSILLLSESKQ
jgi:hypothetical protein